MTEKVHNPSQVTALLDNTTLARLEQMRLNCFRKFTNPTRGEHLYGRGGQSMEFSDYREYVEGDDIRDVDWNIFARLQKPYIKLFHQEQELHVMIIIDASGSMDFQDKLLKAKQLAAAFSVVSLFGGERVSVWAYSSRESRPMRVGPVLGRNGMLRIFAFLEQIQQGGDAPIEEGVTACLKHHKGRGVAILLSDFMTEADVTVTFNELFSHGLEVLALQVLSPGELDPSMDQDARLVDIESGSLLDISGAHQLLKLYHEYRMAQERMLSDVCKKRNGRFAVVNAGHDLRQILLNDLVRRGWLV